MGVREQVLYQLECNRGAVVSGAGLAAQLSVSRTAVWKAVEALRQAGYAIHSEAGGYCLDVRTDMLSAESIGRFLEAPDFYKIRALRTVDSTNRAAKGLAADGAPEGTVVVAEAQSAGRGRLGRAFYSPEGTGAYFSVVLRPRVPAMEAQQLTTIAAVSVCEAIEQLAGRAARIKWVNDVLVDGRKVCGILTEASLDLEGGGVEYAVVGIGLNVRMPQGGMPEALRDIAGEILGDDAPGHARSQLVAETLNRFYAHYRKLGEKHWLEGYRARSAVVGREIEVLKQGGARRALALSIDDRCALNVRYEDGTEEALASGEVSTRL